MGPKSKGPKCEGCGNKINSKEVREVLFLHQHIAQHMVRLQPVITALDKKYHKSCFACVNCNKTIEGDFHPEGNKPWCNDCYLEHKATRCADCGQPIVGTIMKTDDGRTFHEECSKKLTQGMCEACKSEIGFTEVTAYRRAKVLWKSLTNKPGFLLLVFL